MSAISVKGEGNFSLLRRQFQFAPKFGFVTPNVLKTLVSGWITNRIQHVIPRKLSYQLFFRAMKNVQ